MNTSTYTEKRTRLVALITQAAELEHALCCMYLFSAFSMKLEPDDTCTIGEIELLRRWKGTMLSIARQEMEHLAITANLLTALGEAPNLRRPDFPTNRKLYDLDLHFGLLPFSLRSLALYIMAELPADHQSVSEMRKALESIRPDGHEAMIASLEIEERKGIDQMYLDIQALLEELGAADEDRLFIGQPDAQVSNTLLYETFPPVPPSQRVYDVLVTTVVDTGSAVKAVEQIRAEGEGSGLDTGQGHYQKFRKMFVELAEAKSQAAIHDRVFEPARPVGVNPKLPGYEDISAEKRKVTIIQDPTAELAVRIYDKAYNLLLKMLIQFFAMTGEDQRATYALQSVAFFPLMTLVMRPLGDMLADLPAFEGNDGVRAGPTFDCGRDVALVPHNDVAWRLFYEELMALKEWTEQLAEDRGFPEDQRHRIVFMAQNFWRMAYNIAVPLGLEPPK